MLQNVFSFSRTLRVLCEFCVSNAYTWTIYFYSLVLYVQLRFQLSSHSFHPQYLWQFSKQLADSYLVLLYIASYHSWLPLEVKWKWLSHAQLCDPMNCNLPGSSVHGILQARILQWVSVPFSRGSSQSGIEPKSPTLQADTLPSEPWLSLSHSHLLLIWSEDQKYTGFYL